MFVLINYSLGSVRVVLCATCVVPLFLLLFVSTNVSADVEVVDGRLDAISVNQTNHSPQHKVKDTLTLVSLNIAHGRRTSLNQIFVSHKKTRENLQQIADHFTQLAADIVALQEADASSWWSGNFNHVAFLAQHGKYPYFVHQSHARIWIGNYGTGILSRLPIRSGYAHTFAPTPPTTRKGFTIAEIEWQTKTRTVIVDVVSVHLDFSRSSVRKQQLKAMRATFSKRQNPIILMGDFNSEWIADQLTNNHTAASTSFHTSFVRGKSFNTYKDKRLDWILVSKAFTIETYNVSPHILSDHLAVVATIRLVPSEGDLR